MSMLKNLGFINKIIIYFFYFFLHISSNRSIILRVIFSLVTTKPPNNETGIVLNLNKITYIHMTVHINQ